MIYTLQEGQSFDAEMLRQELVVVIGPDGWYINTAGNTVEFVALPDFVLDPSDAVLAHFANGTIREANKAVLKQIAELESKITPRRIREALKDATWMNALDAEIAVLRGQLK
jgi:hypothetical protein